MITRSIILTICFYSINYCNEKLQNHFNDHIFSLEKIEYGKENVDVKSVDFADNSPCLELLEGTGIGIFALLDDEISVPKCSDLTFLQKIKKQHAANKFFPKTNPKFNHECFDIFHYAGQVLYNVNSFLEKNKDRLQDDLAGVMMNAGEDLVKKLFKKAESEDGAAPENPKAARNSSPKKKESRTLASLFKKQLTGLMTTINSTYPHFIRCMKPNSLKKGGIYQAEMMMCQLRYSGLLEVCRIRQYGYPSRKPFKDFTYRYKCFAPKVKSHDELLELLKSKGILKAGEYAVGKTKVFMKSAQNVQLEIAREDALKVFVSLMQKTARGYIFRKKYRNWAKVLSFFLITCKNLPDYFLNI